MDISLCKVIFSFACSMFSQRDTMFGNTSVDAKGCFPLGKLQNKGWQVGW